MGHHDDEVRFCWRCGGSLQQRRLEDGQRLVCDACGSVCYLDPKVVACCLVARNGLILLLKRAIEPQRDKWVLPGGYVDRGEPVADAAVREAEEECGLSVSLERLLGVYSYRGDPHVVVVFVASAPGEARPGAEAGAAEWFELNRIPWQELAFRSTAEGALDDY